MGLNVRRVPTIATAKLSGGEKRSRVPPSSFSVGQGIGFDPFIGHDNRLFADDAHKPTDVGDQGLPIESPGSGVHAFQRADAGLGDQQTIGVEQRRIEVLLNPFGLLVGGKGHLFANPPHIAIEIATGEHAAERRHDGIVQHGHFATMPNLPNAAEAQNVVLSQQLPCFGIERGEAQDVSLSVGLGDDEDKQFNRPKGWDRKRNSLSWGERIPTVVRRSFCRDRRGSSRRRKLAGRAHDSPSTTAAWERAPNPGPCDYFQTAACSAKFAPRC